MPIAPQPSPDARFDVPSDAAPLAVRPLEYDRADAAPDGWRFAARAGAWAAVALGAVQVVIVAAYLSVSGREMLAMVGRGLIGAVQQEVLNLVRGLGSKGCYSGCERSSFSSSR